ncbi:MAG: fumarylacetoacetate hydrolase family protein [Caldilineaceae bacterium]|nr:fumarylacetoacetate hydrolase family protein [Caldilineaceae bacterium]
MKLATFIRDQQQRVGAVVDGRVIDLAAALQASGKGDPATASSVLTLLAAGPDSLEDAKAAVAWAETQGADIAYPLEAVKLAAPIPCPGKLLCLAGNYASHILEGGGSFAGKEKMIPRFFSKPCTSVVGTGDAIRVPASTGFADWELELAVVIGKTGRDLTPAQATEYIAGYTIFNDISARELTFRKDLPQQEGDWFFDWLVGKWFDTFGPMGPWLTTADEIERPDNLRMQLWYNGQLQQDANTGQMIFSPAEAIAFISQFVTLQPGDIISTGTPAGVGLSKKMRLNPGDHIRGEIEGLGVLENSVERLD